MNLSTDQPNADSSVDEAALHGFAVFSRLAAEAAARNLPVIVDA